MFQPYLLLNSIGTGGLPVFLDIRAAVTNEEAAGVGDLIWRIIAPPSQGFYLTYQQPDLNFKKYVVVRFFHTSAPMGASGATPVPSQWIMPGRGTTGESAVYCKWDAVNGNRNVLQLNAVRACHEMYHAFCGLEHRNTPGKLMNQYEAPGNTTLDADQWQLLVSNIALAGGI